MKSFLDQPQLQLYTLIWQRFVASQMSPAIYDTLRIDVRAGQSSQRYALSIARCRQQTEVRRDTWPFLA